MNENKLNALKKVIVTLDTALEEIRVSCPRQLVNINIERRFGGWLPVFLFADKKTENASKEIHCTPELALAAALKQMKKPFLNIRWWIE